MNLFNHTFVTFNSTYMKYFKSKKDIHSGYGKIPKGTVLSEQLWMVIIGRKPGHIDAYSKSDSEWWEEVNFPN